jgi:hypothetical protein
MHLLGLFGLLLILLGEGLSVFHILPWSHYVFPLFWYGYILVLDHLNYRLSGSSLFLDHRREFLLMFPVSAIYWYFFEWYNLVIENWIYINTPEEAWIGTITKIISFATVIPALYETTELVKGIVPKGKGLRVRSLIPQNWHSASLILGICLFVLPLVLPRYFVDAINDRLGRTSILGDWQKGELRRTSVILIAGYLCGFFWEFWNYWAYTKWVYTVPIWEMPQIFEMPALGFLGFGPFALETFAFWTLIWGRK